MCDVSASFDGTWQRRGYASLNGVLTAISIENGKCLDYECLTKNCKMCEMWHSRKEKEDISVEDYDEYKEHHDCPINHIGSAAAMETAGVLAVYKRSVADLNLRYMHYIGDGDTKAYPSVQKEAPYGPKKIPQKGECVGHVQKGECVGHVQKGECVGHVQKGECVGHVQKRVGTRLRRFRKENGKEVLSNGKKLGGIGRLTDKWINKLQNYYGLAIRQNTDNLFNMRKAVGAVLYHSGVASTSEARHRFCTNDSEWCKYRLAEKDGKPFDEKPGLPAVIRDKIMPVFRDLSSEDLLRKCLHGNTQNNNEGLNAFIWKRLPKDIFVGRHVLQMAVCSAVLHFNSIAERMMDVLKPLDCRW